jgi:rhomboid family GlyGly-CTERM serine protease
MADSLHLGHVTRGSARSGTLIWAVVAAAIALPSVVTVLAPSALPGLAWQPELAFSDPWRWWSAAWVHLSERHLWANLAGAALVLALGLAARVAPLAAWAWVAAWPLTHLSLLAQPAITRYGGLSGVLHAGVMAVAVHLMFERRGQIHPTRLSATRWLGVAMAAGVVLKVLIEAPWRAALTHPPGWDIAVAPLAHAAGAFWGGVCALIFVAVARRRG